LGLLAYMSLYFVVFYTLWFAKATKLHHDSYGDFLEKAVLTGLLFAYFIHNIFVFDNLISYILFFFILAYVSIRFDYMTEVKEKDFEKQSSFIKKIDDKILIYGPFILVFLLVSLYFCNFRYIRANFGIYKGLNSRQEAEDKTVADVLNRSLTSFSEAISIGGMAATEAREHLVDITLKLFYGIKSRKLVKDDPNLPIYIKVFEFIDFSKRSYISLIESEKTPDPRTLLIYSTFARSVYDPEHIKYSKLAYDYAPLQQIIALNYIQSLLEVKDYITALVVAEKMYNSDQTFEQARNAYAIVLAYNNKHDEAIKISPGILDQINAIKKEIQK